MCNFLSIYVLIYQYKYCIILNIKGSLENKRYILEEGGCDMTGIFKHDVIKIDLSGAIGSEQGKVRYAVVVQNDKGNFFCN